LLPDVNDKVAEHGILPQLEHVPRSALDGTSITAFARSASRRLASSRSERSAVEGDLAA
jgi:hypothetical protein